MTEKDLLYTLALQKASKIGDITAKKLIQHCGSPEEIFKEKAAVLQSIDGIGSFLTKSIKDASILIDAEKELNYLEKNNIKHWYFQEEAYPNRLKNCIDGPILLFHSGTINLKHQKIISIVGTRNITNYGKILCEQIIDELSVLNPVIVSGFAYGTDITAHKSAIKNNIQTIGCLAHGLNQIYPKVHKKHIHEVEKNGGFVTEFWSTSNPDRENFIKRNRVIAGLSEATLVIESAEKGGSLITADIANSYNREVFATPGRPEDKLSIGTNNLIKLQRAQLVTSAADIIYMLNWETKNSTVKPIQQQLFIELNETEETIVSFLKGKDKVDLDTIAISCQLPIYSISSTLLNLELKGVIRPHPGKQFEHLG
ncbi:MAG: DNA-protecting protein DprA [Kordia sp.]|nr:MAG: DNA-protecting protein DprA [Kordia sp.]